MLKAMPARRRPSPARRPDPAAPRRTNLQRESHLALRCSETSLSVSAFARLRELRRDVLILDGLCLHALSSFQRTDASPSEPSVRGTFLRYSHRLSLSTPTPERTKKLLRKCWSNRPPSRGGYRQAGPLTVRDRASPVNPSGAIHGFWPVFEGCRRQLYLYRPGPSPSLSDGDPLPQLDEVVLPLGIACRGDFAPPDPPSRSLVVTRSPLRQRNLIK